MVKENEETIIKEDFIVSIWNTRQLPFIIKIPVLFVIFVVSGMISVVIFIAFIYFIFKVSQYVSKLVKKK
jgi:hypothetical protein